MADHRADALFGQDKSIKPDIETELPAEAQQLLPGDLEDLTPAELLNSEDSQMLQALELLEALPTPVEEY